MSYAKHTKGVFLVLMEAILETLGVGTGMLHEFQQGTQMLVMNHFPPCPEPELVLGMPPHSDYGFLTILLQDKVKGLQVQHDDHWITVDPIVGSLFVNVGDHLEIFSNGRYKSVLHRVLVNRSKSRSSVASLHSLPFDSVVRPPPEIVDGEERLYADTDFASFLNYMTSHETKHKHFLESRKVVAVLPAAKIN
ncbi:putative 2-oxoglutarate/Fe(II)-dependent dioxygenase [Platanthera guangdongensis]|uniref:2-oxoglutarate/Fe(II)-dependent dioxygenase n=1 Tax=Platanthera guangdongensis TaxID=2320717 RepID=A0ABR2LMP6_9ASPA